MSDVFDIISDPTAKKFWVDHFGMNLTVKAEALRLAFEQELITSGHYGADLLRANFKRIWDGMMEGTFLSCMPT